MELHAKELEIINMIYCHVTSPRSTRSSHSSPEGARPLVARTDHVVLDEPTSALDVSVRAEIL
jgi:hypothetical protein